MQFKLPSRRLESWTKHAPSTHTGSLLKYGPYKQAPGFAAAPLRLHYENNAPFAEVMKLEREIEVSHWGNIYIEERYELQHGGAKHQVRPLTALRLLELHSFPHLLVSCLQFSWQSRPP